MAGANGFFGPTWKATGAAGGAGAPQGCSVPVPVVDRDLKRLLTLAYDGSLNDAALRR